jgi:phage gp46-like protein
MDVFDIGIFECGTGGDINIKSGDIEVIHGLTNQVYLALFGGNIEQNTEDVIEGTEERRDWWGNAYLARENQFNSNFERALMSQPLTSGGISRLEDAAKKDLKFLNNYADIIVSGSITAPGHFQLSVQLKYPGGNSTKIKFLWDGTQGEIIEQTII